MNDLISVIVPVYNVQKYLPRCIESILNQSYKDIELILVDDGSPDNTGEICDYYAKKDSRVVVIHKENGGVSSARNAGLNIAKGKFINFVDSDDYIPNDSLENLINLQKENDADLVCCTFERLLQNGNIVQTKFYDKVLYIDNIKSEEVNIFLSNHFRGPCAKLYRSSILKCNNLFFDEKIKIGEDSIFVYSFLSKLKCVQCSNLVVYKYVANEDSATRKMYKNFYKYIVEDVKTQINFFTSLNIDETISRGASCRCIISGIDYVFHHYFKYFSYEKAVEFTNQFFKNFETFFINKDKNIEMFLINTFNGKTTLNIYKKLVSNNGVLKYCKYTKLKMNLKKIKILNRLNNWLKGRK